MNRHKARENAFLLVFESLFLDLGFEKLLCIAAEMEEIKLNEYSKKIIAGVLQHRTEIDEKIKLFLKNWEIDRIPMVLRAILEISFYEILYVQDVDPPVSINEAVELAKEYFADDGPSFVNGVLGNFVKSINLKEN